MKYLIKMELFGAPPGAPQETLRHLEQMVMPAHDELMRMEAEHKILSGGVLSGRRGIVMVVDADSHAAVTQLLAGLPLWGSHQVEVSPLESFQERLALLRQQADYLNQVVGRGV
ncbi:MAG: hypothetical protein HY741_08660 [Chloroflexi bacterium]|nr:hypothetical protein [Chloroflexota bacterium]